MTHKANPRLIGGFVVGALVLTVIVFIVFGSGKYFVKKDTYVVYFPSSVSGLSPGDPVKVKGITIGPNPPGFVTLNVFRVLQEKFDLRLTGKSAKEDLDRALAA